MFFRQCMKIAVVNLRTQSSLYRNHLLLCRLRRQNVLNVHTFRSSSSATVKRRGENVATNNKLQNFDSRKDHNDEYRNTLSSEELLEKMMAALSKDIHQKNRVYKNDLLRIINKVKELNFSTKKQGLKLLRCCTELLPDESASSRMKIVEEIWNTLKPHTEFTVDHYNELLKVYTANKMTLNVGSFIQRMDKVEPNIATYELLLTCLAQAGDVNQATEVISNMKTLGLPATENVFNALILCQGKAGNLQNLKEVLTMMQSLKLDATVDTHTAVLQALAWNNKTQPLLDEMNNFKRNGVEFEERHIMEIVKVLASLSAYGTITQVLKFLPEETLSSPSISPYMQSVSTLLVFQNHPVAALEIYKCLPLPSFGPRDDQGLHGRSLVRDCVKASMPSSVIGLITQELMASGRNPIALQNAAEASLQLGKIPLTLDLFSRMKQLGMPLRPHYFWPILLHSSKSYGEKGIFTSLAAMNTMDVKPDHDTMMEYVLPYVSFTSPQNLMKKLIETGLTATTVLTPMMETLLNTGQVRAASEICELFNGKVDAENVMKSLVKGYLTSEDTTSTIHILEDVLQKAIEKNKDWSGRFLCTLMQHKKLKYDLTDFIIILKAMKAVPIRISTSASDYCICRLTENYKSDAIETVKSLLTDITDDRVVDDGDMFTHQIVHPKYMTEESLSAHLKELEAKGMNTRGVLRKLLQKHCREGNLKAAREIAEKCQREGVFLSAGMKAAIFDLHVKLGELDLAELALADLNKTSPNFTLDEFKVIDFATLMVYRKKIRQAFDLITEESKQRRITGGRNIAMNCWRLLDAMAAHATHVETKKMFELLTSLRYCQPSNALLGPLVRAHLKNDNLQEAVNEFYHLSNKYNKTPLKHELLSKILWKLGDDGIEEKFIVNEKANGRLNKMAETVLNVDKKVHGPGDVQLTLIGALAEVGYKKSLRKLFLDPSVKFHPDALLRKCERFADEGKAKPLENIAECAKELRHIDIDAIYDMVIDVYHRTDEHIAALALWTKMQEDDVTPTQKFIETLASVLRANNKQIPPELSLLLDKQSKKVSN